MSQNISLEFNGVKYSAWSQEALAGAGVPSDVIARAQIASVTDLQFRLALTAAGIRPQAEAYIASASQDVKDWWDRATVIHRDNPMIIAAAEALDVDAETFDMVFLDAATR